MSPLMALPVPFVGSNPLPSVGISAVRDPPACGGWEGALDGPAVICTCCCGLCVDDVEPVAPAFGALVAVALRVVVPDVLSPPVVGVSGVEVAGVEESDDAEVDNV